ncbi:MAG: hypothetical protein R3F33_01775 [Planctomycetota bacterium]
MSKTRTSALLLGTLVLSSLASAQGLYVSYVSDSGDDVIWRFEDVNANGNYNDAGEMTVYYDGTTGPVALASAQGTVLMPDGALIVSDGTNDVLGWLKDLDNDNLIASPGEAVLWFDGNPANNPGGITMASARGMWADDDGTLWVAVANSGTGGIDAILRCKDMNSDGDANDLGEVTVFYDILPGGSTGESIPADVMRGKDGRLYYVENGTSGVHPKGVYLLQDIDNSGAIDQPGEELPYFMAPAQASTAQHWCLSQMPNGDFLMGDNLNEIVWRFADANSDDFIDPVTEATQYWTGAASSNIWSLQAVSDTEFYAVEDQTPDRLLVMRDVDMNGTIDPVTEVFEVYDETIAPIAANSVRTMTVVLPQGGGVGTAFCHPADANSTGVPAELSASFGTGVGSDLHLEGTNGPAGEFGYFLVGSGFVDPGLALPQGGHLCLDTAQSLGRYNVSGVLNSVGQFDGSGVLQNLVGTSAVGSGFDVPATVPIAGNPAIMAGDTWYFQLWYRDTPAGTGSANLSNGLAVTFP